ncbi:hypothetical protein TRIP_B200192 [uncultured Desulfatiglans sp.]|uniref:Glycosyltransferase 2-like domain-containing protein n=1 Tax=Uncultured Desulfatiglans sp. TaxID=1748965 RepID=A0A653A320_UNCDX|nr:hypothetical protein TRIP_B200192 [uncultured Desulfatiglans sp.]
MIDVVIVTYNRKPLLFRNLDRLKSSSLIRKVIVVDNASADGTLREGRVRYPDVHWIASPANEGCIAWNRGMEAVRTPWALILDDDCFVQDAPLEQACAFAARTPSIGLAAFNVISEKTGSSEWGATIDGIRTATDWPNAIGACMLTNTQAFRSVGGYKDFFLCFNDLELVLNLWRNGYRVVFHPDWTACHLGPRPAPSERRFPYEIRNLLWTAWGHLDTPFCFALTLKFVSAAIFDLSGRHLSEQILRPAWTGIRKGRRMRDRSKPKVPPHIRRLLFKNLFLSGRTRSLRNRLMPPFQLGPVKNRD